MVDKVKDKSIKRDIPLAPRWGTIGLVITALDAAQCAAEDELALNDADLARYTASSSFLQLRRRFYPFLLSMLYQPLSFSLSLSLYND